jgi:hypothetical protein
MAKDHTNVAMAQVPLNIGDDKKTKQWQFCSCQ